MSQKMRVYIFVTVGLGVFALLVLSAAHSQGWFSPSERFFITFNSGEGLFVGTPVSIAGLKAGQVTNIELDKSDHVTVAIKVQQKFANHIHLDSKATLGRPFIIGEKAISISPGTPQSPLARPKSTIQGEESLEITDLLSGGRVSPYFKTFGRLMDQIQVMVEGDGTANHVPLIALYSEVNRAMKALENVGTDLHLIRTDFANADDTKKLVHQLAGATENLGRVLAATEQSLPAITKLSTDIGIMIPQVNETMHETVFTLQALQRSFILSGGVEKLKHEQNSSRMPASEK